MELTDTIKEKVLTYIDDIEVDVEALESYKYHSASYSWNSCCPEPAWDEWDEDEEKSAKIGTFIGWLKYDLVVDYIDVDDDTSEKDAETRELTNKVIEWLKGKQ